MVKDVTQVDDEGCADAIIPRFSSFASHTQHVDYDSIRSKSDFDLNIKVDVVAGNSMSQVQALSVDINGSQWWSTQYHPEFDLQTASRLILIPATVTMLLKQGRFTSEESLVHYSNQLASLYADPDRTDIKHWLGIDDDVALAHRLPTVFFSWLRHISGDESSSPQETVLPDSARYRQTGV